MIHLKHSSHQSQTTDNRLLTVDLRHPSDPELDQRFRGSLLED
ncbi:MAG: hypothetical protein WCB68_11140 [Pyrinomonadaceae bacterium]